MSATAKLSTRSEILKKIEIVEHTLNSDGLHVAYNYEGTPEDLVLSPREAAKLFSKTGLVNSNKGERVLIETFVSDDETRPVWMDWNDLVGGDFTLSQYDLLTLLSHKIGEAQFEAVVGSISSPKGVRA